MSCTHPAIALRHDKKSAYCLSCNAEMGERFAEERAESMALRFRFEDAMDAKDAEIARLKAEIDETLQLAEHPDISNLKDLARELCYRAGEILRLRSENLRLANENAALVAQIPNGFRFPNDGDARMID